MKTRYHVKHTDLLGFKVLLNSTSNVHSNRGYLSLQFKMIQAVFTHQPLPFPVGPHFGQLPFVIADLNETITDSLMVGLFRFHRASHTAATTHPISVQPKADIQNQYRLKIRLPVSFR